MEPDRKRLDRYEFQMGPARGRLATALDMLTDALALVGQHGIYCRSAGRPEQTALDIRLVIEQVQASKDLILEAMAQIQRSESKEPDS